MSLRAGKDIALMLGFALIALSIFALGTEDSWRQSAAPSMIWSVILFSTLLMIEQIFGRDHATGRLDVLLSQPIPRWIIVLAKIGGFWLRTGLPILLTAPIAGILFGFNSTVFPTLIGSVLIGTLSLSCFATVGAALTFSAKQPVMLVMVLVLPIQIPVLIFATFCLEFALMGYDTLAGFLWLGVCLMIGVACIPFGAMAMHRETTACDSHELD